MVDGVNFNPFTGKALTAEEIQKLDTNNDGVVSSTELAENLNSISLNETDDEGDVQIEDTTQQTKPETGVTDSAETDGTVGNTETTETTESVPELDTRGQGIYNAAINNGAQSTADTQQELQESLTKVESQYIEKILAEQGEAAASDASGIITYLRNQKTEFLNQYLENNPQGPYDMATVSAAYIQAMDTALTSRQEGVDAFNESIEDKKAAADNFKALYDAANSTGSYMDPDEYKNLKDMSVDYIIGQMLNGEVDADFLSALNEKYQSDSNYIAAQNAIKSMQAATDPVKMQEYLTKAEEAIGKLIGNQNVDGSSKLADAINGQQDKAVNNEYKEILSELIDDMAEAYSNETETRKTGFFGIHNKTVLANSEEDVANYAERLKNIMNDFLADYDGDGTNIEAEFKKQVNEVNAQLENIDNNILDLITRGVDWEGNNSEAYNTLLSKVNDVGSYISNDEREDIINSATDYFIASMADGTDLSTMYPDYATDQNYIEAKALMDGLRTSATPQEDYDKIKELLSGMLENRGVDSIIDGVKAEESKNVSLTPGSLTDGLWGYGTNDTYGGDNKVYVNYQIDESGQVVWTHNNDKGDVDKVMNQLLDRIKERMEEQLGSLYNEADIEKYFNDAIIEQLVNFGSIDNTVSVESLVDGVISEFNTIATNGLKGTTKSVYNVAGRIDRTQALKDSDAVDDYTGSKIIASKSKAQNTAKEKLELLRASLLSQAQTILGEDYIESDVDTMITQAINDTLNNTRLGFSLITIYDPDQMYDYFFNAFDEKLLNYQDSK